jgi:hypothetical protein
MKTPIEERYVLSHLSLIDMERVRRSIEYLADMKDEHLREALFRDAVVSYAKPFSDNRGIFTRKGLRISEKGIPDQLKSAHLEIISVRDKLFAHMDLDNQKPELRHYEIGGEKHHPFTVTGYGTVYADHLIEPLGQLAKAVHAHLMQELQAIEANHF